MRSPLLAIALALASLCASPVLARAAWTVDGFAVAPPAQVGLWNVHLQRDGTGDLLAAWRAQDSTAWHTDVARIAGDGGLVPNWSWPSTIPSSAFTPDGGGGAFAAYTGSTDIYLEHLLATGGPDPAWPAGAFVGDTLAATPGIEFYPTATADGTGGAYVAWVNESLDQLLLQRVQGTGHVGAGWVAGGRVVATDPAFGINSWPPRLCVDGTGGVVAMWIADQPRVQRYTGAGAVAAGWPAAGLQIGTSGYSNAFQDVLLALMPSGPDDMIAAWFDSTTGGPRRIWVQRFHGDGTISAGWPAAGVLVLDATTSVGGFTVVGDGAGGAIVGWQQGTTVRAVRVLASGALAAGWPAAGLPLLDAKAVYGGGVYIPGLPLPGFALAPGPANGLVVAWTDLRDSGRRHVRTRWLLGDGTPDPSQPDSGRVANPDGQRADVRALIEDGAGGVVVAWEDQDLAPLGLRTLKATWLPYPVALDVPPTPAPRDVATLAAAPNPARSSCAVRFALADAAPARLELLDLAGRRVRSQTVAGAGEHTVRFERLDTLAPGIYLVRLAEGGRVRTARVALVR